MQEVVTENVCAVVGAARGDGGPGWGPPAMPKGNLILKGSHYPQAAAIRYAVNPSDPIYPGVG